MINKTRYALRYLKASFDDEHTAIFVFVSANDDTAIFEATRFMEDRGISKGEVIRRDSDRNNWHSIANLQNDTK